MTTDDDRGKVEIVHGYGKIYRREYYVTLSYDID